MTAGIALLAGLAVPAQALPFNLQPQAVPDRPAAQRPARPTGVVTAAREKPAAKENTDDIAARAKGVLGVVISIDKQQLTLYSDGRPIAQSRVSTGTASHPTPTGVFSVIQKNRWHRSNLYQNAPMYFMQRITWSGVAMHQGIVPNHPASHGCIRLPEAFARQMWGITRLGVRVIVARGEVAPVAIAHARLFTKREPIEAALEAGLDRKPDTGRAAEDTSAELVKAAHGALEVARLAANGRDATATDARGLGNPALDAMAYAIATPRETVPSAVTSAFDGFDKPARPRILASTEATEPRPLKPGPISVFISRKEGKLYLRKGFEPVFNVPVTFVEPERPLGTHVFTALALADDGTTMRWNVVTMPGGSGPSKVSTRPSTRPSTKPSTKASDKAPDKGKRVEPAAPASTAAQALDRVTIPQEALDRISELMSPGASLIISDQGLGAETGKGTDFIVLTR